jgi:hypothetical protein
MSLLVDPSRNRGRDRSRGDKRIRSAQEAQPKDTYYRKEYGWIMSDAQVKEEKGVKGLYDNAVAETQSNIDTARTDFDNAAKAGRGQINSAYDDAVKGIKKGKIDTVFIRVLGRNDEIEQVYEVPRDYAKEFATKSEGLWTNWHPNNQFLYVSVEAKGGGKNVGKKLHSAFGDAQTQTRQYQANNETVYKQSIRNANTQRDKELGNYKDLNAKNRAASEEIWNTELDTSKAAYGKRVAGGKNMYEESKKNYNDSIMGMDEGLLESRTKPIANENVIKEQKTNEQNI